MDDRALLELAAKAAGYAINFDEPVNGYYPHGYDDNGDVDAWWNPLADDGDALRLAVKLRFMPAISNTGATAGYERITNVRRPYLQPICEDFGDDPNAATRRAIVRAAAEIGRGMP